MQGLPRASYPRDLRQHCLAGKGRQADPYYRIGPMGAKRGVLVIDWDISSDRDCMVVMRCRWPGNRRHVLRQRAELFGFRGRSPLLRVLLGTYPGTPGFPHYLSCPGELCLQCQKHRHFKIASHMLRIEKQPRYNIITKNKFRCRIIKVPGPSGLTV